MLEPPEIMEFQTTQITIFFLISASIAFLTYLGCRGKRSDDDTTKEYFLAGGELTWIFVAGSITLTNLSTSQLIGMNGNQMALMAWWEFSAVAGLAILCFVFLPIYYKYNCTTSTELLEKRFQNKNIRVLISILFIFKNLAIYLPFVIYSGGLFIQALFGVDLSIYSIAIGFALAGAAYSIFGGLRAVAVSDTYNGVLLLSMAVLVVWLALDAIDFDFSGIPADRLTLVGGLDSDIPWQTLFTGMIFIQIFTWGCNQSITQRAMASPTVKEAQKGVIAAGVIRLLVIPPIICIPGIVSYKLYGDIGDLAYGRIVGDVLPHWLSGAFAAAIAAAVLSTYNSILNSTVALYVCDIHQNFINKDAHVRKLSTWVTMLMVALTIVMVPVYNDPDSSLTNTLQKLFGLLSMPILASFLIAILFKDVDSKAMIASVIFGVGLYAFFIFQWTPFGLHYIHLMFITLMAIIGLALLLNRVVFGQVAKWDAWNVFAKAQNASF